MPDYSPNYSTERNWIHYRGYYLIRSVFYQRLAYRVTSDYDSVSRGVKLHKHIVSAYRAIDDMIADNMRKGVEVPPSNREEIIVRRRKKYEDA